MTQPARHPSGSNVEDPISESPAALPGLRNYWMPFTANRAFKASPRLVSRAEGVHLYTPDGRAVLDGSSGLFCVAAGHGRSEIAEAVHAQLRTLDYSAPFQLGHPGAFQLAERLCGVLPEGLSRVFFVNSGSEAVDTALKIALAYHRARGEAGRHVFVSRERAYHGVNLGGTSLSGLVRNREAFGVASVPHVVHMRHTLLPENRFVLGQAEHGADLALDLQRCVDTLGADAIAACVVEPVAGSIGCYVPPRGYLERLRDICDRYGILLIFDEVICGFGRLGAPFAADLFGVAPDIATFAKFFHGYTWSGHPAACAAALATLDIFEREGLFARAAELAPTFLGRLAEFGSTQGVLDVRGIGLFGAVDVEPIAGRPGVRGAELAWRLFDAGLHLKFTGDTALIAPPLVAQTQDLDRLFGILGDTLARG
jgi:beta-alanine--pyruvate transaminase